MSVFDAVTPFLFRALGGVDLTADEIRQALEGGAGFSEPAMWAELTATGSLVNVQAYGAVGDGVTDDTAAILAAFTASQANDRVFFPRGTYLVDAEVAVPQDRTVFGVSQTGSTIKAKDGAGLAGVLVSAGWLANNTTSGNPMRVFDLGVDANRANSGVAAGGHGIVTMNYRSVVARTQVRNAYGSGILQAATNSAGTPLTNTNVENRIYDNTVYTCGVGIDIENNGAGSNTDGYLAGNIVYSTDTIGIRNSRAAGWFIRDNHCYAIGTTGFHLENFWNTYVVNNEVDGFAVANTGTCMGINVESILSGRPGVITGNCVSANEAPRTAATYIYYRLRNASSGIDTSVVFEGNTANADSQGGTNPRWCSFQPNSGTLRVALAGNVVRNFITQDPTVGTPGTILLSSGDEPLVFATGYPLGIKRAANELPYAVAETMPRDSATGSPSPSAGTVQLSYFTATDDELAAVITTYSRSTAGVGTTATYVGLYSEASNGDLTKVSESDASVRWNAANSTYPAAQTTPVRKVIGQRYAVATLHLGSSTLPTLAGTTSVAGMLQLAPRKTAALTGQTSLPASISAASLTTSGSNVIYARITAA